MIKILCATASVAFLSSFALAQNATVSVLHGIPGLAQPVEVFANGSRLFAFDFGDLEGPLSVPPGVTNLEVRLNGSTILQAAPDLQADVNYTVVAHLLEGGGNQLTAFVNDLSRLEGIGEYFATVAFRHVADAPAVDVFADRLGREVKVYTDVASGGEGLGWQQAPAYLLSGPTDIRLTPTGANQTAFGPESIGNLRSGEFYSVFAIGELGQSSFRFVVQSIAAPRPLPNLQTLVRGTACGGQVAFGTTNVQFDQNFDVVLTGGTPNGVGLLFSGFSTTQFFGVPLPLDLGLLGGTGCTLYQDASGAESVTIDGNGNARVTTSIPAALARLVETYGIHYQYGFLSPGANALGAQFTQYASVETN